MAIGVLSAYLVCVAGAHPRDAAWGPTPTRSQRSLRSRRWLEKSSRLDQQSVGSSRRQNATLICYTLISTAAGRSEALRARGGGAPRGFAGVGPRETNK